MTTESGPGRAPNEPIGAMEPIHAPMLRIVEIGMLGWVLVLAATLLVPALHEGQRSWWPWTCVAGLALGALGWVYVRRGRGNAHDA